MSSDSNRRLVRLAVVAGAATVALFAAGCGKKGDPRPAPRTIPQAITDLSVRQRGFEVVLEMAHPKTTVAGLALPGLDEVVLYELVRPGALGAPVLAPGATAPPPTPVLTPDLREFEATSKPTLRIGGAELASAISGDRITLRFRLPEPLPSPAPLRFYGVRTHAVDGEASSQSNLVSLLPRSAPEAPVEFRAVAKKEGIELTWAAGAPELAGYNLYRRAATDTGYGPPLAQLPVTQSTTVDTTAVYGQRFIYAATAVVARDPLVESALSVEREVAFEDRFAPVPPAGLTALPGAGEVRLVWEPVAETDVAGYVVERSEPGNEFHRIGPDSVGETELVDRGLGSGFTFRYRVAAIDKSGNLGAFSTPVDARVP